MRATLHLTQTCNLACSYCYAGAQSDNVMSADTARTAIDFLFDQLTGDDLSLTFFGGEPLLAFPMIRAVVPYAQQKAAAHPGVSVRFAVNTNATILSEEIADFLREQRFELILSVDGIAAAHDAHRRFPNDEGSFAVVERNLATFLRINPYVIVISVITPENVDHLRDSVLYLVERGVRLIRPTVERSAAWDDASFKRLKRAYNDLADTYIDLHRRDLQVFIGSVDDRIFSRVRGDRPRTACQLGEAEISIAPDGTLFPCVQFINAESVKTKDKAIGHVNDGWDRPARAAVIAESNAPSERCSECALNGRCVNWCGCINYRTTGKLNEMSAFSCAHEQMLFPIVDRIGATLHQEKNRVFEKKFYDPSFSFFSDLG